MGGALKVIVRFSDGRVVSETRGTNSLPFWIMHPRLIKGDETLLREYVAMPSDFRDADTTYAPVEYGTFVVDHKTRTILSANRYSDCRSMLIVDSRGMCRKLGASYECGGYAAFAELLMEGFLQVRSMEARRPIFLASEEERIREASRPAFVPERIDLAGVTPANWDGRVYEPYSQFGGRYARMSVAEEMEAPVYEAIVDHKGWTHTTLDDGVEGQDKVREALRDLGFPFTGECERAYRKWWRRAMRARSEEDAGAEAC